MQNKLQDSLQNSQFNTHSFLITQNDFIFPNPIEQEKSKNQLFESLKLASGKVSADELLKLLNEACKLLFYFILIFKNCKISAHWLSRS